MAEAGIPTSFIWRRIHSLLGLFLVLFIIEHLLTNSQAALLIGDDGGGFIRMVNLIHSLPYLPAIEIGMLGMPIVLHAVWGIKVLLTAEPNSGKTDGSTPALGEYPRNKGYTWQRLTSWFLLIAIAVHVYEMRFEHYPVAAHKDGQHHYIVRLSMDSGLYTVADRLDVELFDKAKVEAERLALAPKDRSVRSGVAAAVSTDSWLEPVVGESYSPERAEELRQRAHQHEQREWVHALEKLSLEDGQVNAVAADMGTAVLLTVRDTFKSPLMMLLYSIFVLAATFHAFNGLWTFVITWGIAMTERSQVLMRRLCVGLIFGVTGLGWAAIWGTYWINLRY